MGKAKAHRCFSTPKISSSITRRGTNPSEGSRGNSRVAPTTDSLAEGAPIAPASPSPERGERSPSQEWQQQLASSWFSPSGWNERQLCGVGLFQGSITRNLEAREVQRRLTEAEN